MLAGSAERESHTPGQPVRTRAEPIPPATTSVEFTDEIEQPRSGGIEVRGELGDLVAEPFELGDLRMSRNDARTIDVHRDSPCADFNPRFSRARDATRTRDLVPIAIFSNCRSPRASSRVYAPQT